MRIPLALTLVAASALSAQSPPMTGATCGADSVQLHTATGVLYGTLTCPSTPAPWPVVLIIAGSGPTDRDGNSPALPGKSNTYLLIADSLATHGIASLRYDKRGIAASHASMVTEDALRFDMYVDDAAEWARELKADHRFSTITIVGHSEGSLLGMVATQRAGADGYVSLEGPGRPAGAVIHEQLARQLPPPMLADADRVIKTLESGKTTDSFPAPLAALFRVSVQPYLVSWFRYDPSHEIARITVPILIVQGTTDIQVSVEDAHLLAAAQPKASLLMIDGMNHPLRMVPTTELAAQTKSYSDPAIPVAPQLMERLIAFVKAVRR